MGLVDFFGNSSLILSMSFSSKMPGCPPGEKDVDFMPPYFAYFGYSSIFTLCLSKNSLNASSTTWL